MLEGKIAIVTGAARGIGRGIAIELARAGADVAIGDLLEQPEVAADAAESAEAVRALGRRAAVFACDVTRFEDCEALVEATLRELGGLHIVVCNAGVLGKGPVLEMSETCPRWQLPSVPLGTHRAVWSD